jgi:NADH-quinone oxidoreductase subunit J
MVVLSKNAVHAAFYLLLTLLGVAAQYALLSAHFLAVVQILVYAGAVIALIVFVLMMMDIGSNKQKGLEISAFSVILPLLLGGVLIAAGGVGLIRGNPLRIQAQLSPAVSPQTAHTEHVADSTKQTQVLTTTKTDQGFGSLSMLGKNLITHNLVAFEMVSILLLMAICGVIILLRNRRLPKSKPRMSTQQTNSPEQSDFL